MIDSPANEEARAADLKKMKRIRRSQSAAPSVDRLPPHSPESELGTLGCCMLSPNEVLPECIERLGSEKEVFYDLRNQIIFEAMVEMFIKSEAIDVITLQQHLKDKQLLEQVGGIAYLTALPDATPSAANLSYYTDIVYEKFLLRKMIHACTDSVDKLYECAAEVDQLIDEVERDVLAVRQMRITEKAEDLRTLVRSAVSSIEEMWSRHGAISGLATGLRDLDRMTDGLHPQEMIVIAAYPGAGKTSLAMNIAEHVAVNQNIPVGIFSLEMSTKSLIQRFIFSRSRINSRNVKDGVLLDGDFPKLTTAASAISKAPLYFDESSFSVYQLCAKARRMWQQHGIKLFIVDYLQLLHAGGSGKKTDNRQQEVADISRNIKCMAKELDVPFITLSQLNDDGRLRESRAIGQDADMIWMLKPDPENPGNADTQPIFLDITKQRNGPTGCVNLTFLKSYVRFENASPVKDDKLPADHKQRATKRPHAD